MVTMSMITNTLMSELRSKLSRERERERERAQRAKAKR